MRALLDSATLEGIHQARINVRLSRSSSPIKPQAELFLAEVERLCSLWGGAVTPIVPIQEDGTLPPLYASSMPGAAIDRVDGLRPYELFDLAAAKPNLGEVRDPFADQLALPLLKYKKPKSYAPLEAVELDPDDPWILIYAACLGLAQKEFDPKLLERTNLIPDLRIEDFIRVNRVSATGSYNDLVERLNARDRNAPRVMSMVGLPYGGSGSSGIRSPNKVLPEPWFSQYDAGPNIVVVCSPGNVEDAILLWNLRGAHGDLRSVPIGLPLAETSTATIMELVFNGHLARNGISVSPIYVTSTSLSTEALRSLIGESKEIAIANPESMLSFGTFGWSRDEVLVWANGRSQVVPLPTDHQTKIFSNRALNRNVYFRVDISVPIEPFPQGDDVRVDSNDGDFYFGSKTTWGMSQILTDVHRLSWPSRMLMARSVAARRGSDLAESEPGRASRVALETMEDLHYLGNLAHAPLLSLLESMAARHGFGWYKQRLRGLGMTASPAGAIGPTVDELPERPFGEFKKALGNSDKATRNWLAWAEKAGLVVKGFPLQCERCQAKQWLPVEAFSPPLICRGCAQEIAMPFGNRHVVDFKYRLSERLRRVYEHDAMGHLLAARFFDSTMSDRLIGLHPGMEVTAMGSTTVLGEADVLLLTRHAELIPVEVKRASTGMTASELEKLDALVTALKSPWSAVVACQYALEMDDDFGLHGSRGSDGSHLRVALSYDAILSPHAFWSIGNDPFEWKPLSLDEIQERQSKFVKMMEDWDADSSRTWSDDVMLSNPAERARKIRDEEQSSVISPTTAEHNHD